MRDGLQERNAWHRDKARESFVDFFFQEERYEIANVCRQIKGAVDATVNFDDGQRLCQIASCSNLAKLE